MRISKNKITTILIILIILITLIYFMKIKAKTYFQDDLLFFKLISQSESDQTKTEVKKTNKYEIQVSKTKKHYKNIELLQTINIKSLANEKIAPGTNGNFEIILTSNRNLKYQIGFISKNEKPKNLKFYTENNFMQKYDTLEKLNNKLNGEIRENQEKSIKIYWEWEYENSQEENIQDTNDGQKISKYNFEIYTIGE